MLIPPSFPHVIAIKTFLVNRKSSVSDRFSPPDIAKIEKVLSMKPAETTKDKFFCAGTDEGPVFARNCSDEGILS